MHKNWQAGLARSSWAGKWGLIFTAVQILVCILLAPQSGNLLQRYLKLNQWDSYHYLDVAEKGYRLPAGRPITAEDIHLNRANLAYFPAYPLLANRVQALLRVPYSESLLVTAQIFCFLFWVQILSLFRLQGLSPRISLFGAFTIGLFPSAFYLVTGYAESTFMASLVGLILWTEVWLRKTRGERINYAWVLAGVCGFTLSASRIVGIALIAYPLVRWLGTWNRRFDPQFLTQIPRVILLALFSAAGGLAFFLWCQINSGHWDIYLRLQKIGWGNEPHFLAILDPRIYFPRLFFEDTTTSVCRASSLFVLLIFAWVIGKELQIRRGEHRTRWGLYFSAITMAYISLAGTAYHQMDSMVRYNLPVFTVLILAAVPVFVESRPESGLGTSESIFPPFPVPSKLAQILWRTGYVLAFAFQIWMIILFTKGGWVA